MNSSERLRRIQIREQIESQCMGFIEEKINRYLEIEHEGIIGDHHFARSSSECIYLYRDGYYIGTVMMSHSINEGIVKFIAERNGVERQKTPDTEKTIEELIDELKNAGIISQNCANASKSIWGSYRNDIHHMNPTVSKIPFQELAQRNIKHLSTIEKEIFGHHSSNGVLILDQPKYWPMNADGTTNTYLRLE